MRNAKGFTLIELMIVVAIIAIIASIAIPNLLSARVNANESAAIATLRNVVSAQSQVQSQGAIDQDLDGIGEHGWFGELSGIIGLRDDTGAIGATLLNPPVLSASLGNVDAAGTVNRSGYFFAMILPAIAGAPLGEVGGGGTPTGEDPNLCENTWACIAWPAARTNTGNRAFCVNQSGDVLQTNNQAAGQLYDGAGTAPALDAPYTAANDMTSPLSIGGVPAAAQDGGNWLVVN